MAATEIPSRVTVNDYIFRLEPPPNKEYEAEVANIMKQQATRANTSVMLKCPKKCGYEKFHASLMKVHLHMSVKTEERAR